MDTLGINSTRKALRYALESDTPIHIIGPPGVGKSAIIAGIAKEMKMPLEILILSLCDPTDIGGFPVAKDGALDRLPLGAIKKACETPVLLFLDELSCASPAVQAAALQLIYGRRAGDAVLHPGTRIVAASNPPDQAAGGWELALPLIGRMTQLKMKPTHKEVQEFFYNLGEENSSIRSLAVDWAATLEADAGLLHIDPPAGAQQSGRPWGAPRSWERGLRLAATATDHKESDTGEIFGAALSGNVGEEAAAAYMAIRKIRHNLPKVQEILEKPKEARLPNDSSTGCACLGIIAQVAMQDPCAAWIYAERLTKEVRVAATRVLGRKEFGLQKHKNSKMYAEADTAQTKLLRSVGDAMRQ